MNLSMNVIEVKRSFCAFVLLVVFFSTQAFTQNPSFVINSDAFTASQIINISQSPKQISVNKSYTTLLNEKNTAAFLYVKLDLGEDYMVKNPNDVFKIKVEVSYTVGTTIVTQPLEITDQNPEQVLKVDLLDALNADPLITNVTLNLVSYTPTVNPSPFIQNLINNNLRLKGWVEREFGVDVRLPNQTMASAPFAVAITPNNKRVSFSWNTNEVYPNYEIQILRLYNTDPLLTTANHIKYKVDWSNALKVETQSFNKTIDLTLMEGSGYYVWRVRPIGTFYPGGIANNENYGLWSLSFQDGQTGELDSYSGPQNVFYFTDIEENLNWIYTRVYTEGDADLQNGVRVSEGITYADNLLRAKQTQAYNSADNQNIVNQSVPDFSGRPALSSLPVPVQSTNGLDGYQLGLIKNANGDVYTAFDYDYDVDDYDTNPVNDYDNDPNNTNRVTKPNTIKQTSGEAFSYYNGTRTDGVADARGYAYSRTIFKNDGTGRTSESSGPGFTHALGTQTNGNKTNRILYGSASDQELIRIFGDEAPLAESVVKTINIDPNGVQSVVYTSKEGKTIASALITNQTAALSALNTDNHQFNVEHSTTQNITDGNIFQSTKRLAIPSAQTVTLSYHVDQSGIGSCLNCQYKVQFYLIDLAHELTYVSDEDGFTSGNTLKAFNIPANNSSLVFPSSWKWVLINNSSASGYSENIDVNYNGTFILPEGEYLLVKKIYSQKVNTQLTVEFVEHLMDLIQDEMAKVVDNSTEANFKTFIDKVHNQDASILPLLGINPVFTAFPADFTLSYQSSGNEVTSIDFSIGTPGSDCPTCGNQSIAIGKADACKICDDIELIRNAAGNFTVNTGTEWLALKNVILTGDPNDPNDSFLEYLRNNESYKAAANPVDFVDQVAPGFTEDKLAFMLTNMLVSKYYIGKTKTNAGVLCYATEDPLTKQLVFTDAAGVLSATPVPVNDGLSTWNYDCKKLYKCWIQAVDLLSTDNFQNGVNVMDEYNDRAETSSEDEYDDESNSEDAEDKSKFQGLMDFIISQKMRKFNDSDEGELSSSQLNNMTNFINSFMNCAGRQFKNIFDEGTTAIPSEYSAYTVSATLTSMHAIIPVTFGSLAPMIMQNPTQVLEIGCCNSSTKMQLAYPYVVKPEWMFKYFVYNSYDLFSGLGSSGFSDKATASNAVLIAQPGIEYVSCYNNPCPTSCTDCKYFHENWSAGQRYNFYAQISGGDKCPLNLCGPGSSAAPPAVTINPTQMALAEVDAAINMCASRSGEFRSDILSELDAMCYDVVECLTVATPYQVTESDIDLMVQHVVTTCSTSVQTVKTKLLAQTGDYGTPDSGGVVADGGTLGSPDSGDYPFYTQQLCYQFVLDTETCDAKQKNILKLFPDCDQVIIDQAQHWKLELSIPQAPGCPNASKVLTPATCTSGSASPSSSALYTKP